MSSGEIPSGPQGPLPNPEAGVCLRFLGNRLDGRYFAARTDQDQHDIESVSVGERSLEADGVVDVRCSKGACLASSTFYLRSAGVMDSAGRVNPPQDAWCRQNEETVRQIFGKPAS